MAKKTSNFKKFGKLASLVKKIADKDPQLLDRILEESESTSKNSWNKIQKWTSKNVFPNFKALPLKSYTKKNVKDFIDGVKKAKKQSCFNVFKIPTADLEDVDVFQLEYTLLSFPKNLQVQIDLAGGDGKVNTGIQQLKDIPNLGSMEFTTNVRSIFIVDGEVDSSLIDEVQFVVLRKKGKPLNDRGNCSYYVKVMFKNQSLSADEQKREVDIAVQLSDLTPKQQKDRKALKKQIKDLSSKKKSKKKTRDFKTPTKVKSTKEDTKIQAKIKKARDPRALADALKILQKDFELGVFNKKEYKEERNKLLDKFEKGGEI